MAGMTRAIRGLLPLAVLSLVGCLSQMAPDDDPVHLKIRWVEDFETARGIAAESGKPILAVMIAGDILDRC